MGGAAEKQKERYWQDCFYTRDTPSGVNSWGEARPHPLLRQAYGGRASPLPQGEGDDFLDHCARFSDYLTAPKS